MNTDTKILNITLACDKHVLLNVTKLVVCIEDEIVEVGIEDEIVEVGTEDEIVEVGIEDEIVEVVDEEFEVSPFIFELIQSS